MSRSKQRLFLGACALLFFSCGDAGTESVQDVSSSNAQEVAAEKSVGGHIRVQVSHEIEGLNPHVSSGADGGHIAKHVFQQVLDIDFETLDITPVLAAKRPEVKVLPSGKMEITHQLRPEARWDNGDPITAKDVEHTLKMVLNPRVDNGNHRSYYEFIEDFVLYDDDPLKYTIICSEPYLLSEAVSGDYMILPPYVYDPKGLMSAFTVAQLQTEGDELKDNPAIVEFADWFNREQFKSDPAFIEGSGAYKIEEWVEGQRIVLKRKENWWGDEIADQGAYFEAWPERISYIVINDYTTAEVALKGGNIDLIKSVPPDQFTSMVESPKIKEHFNAHSPAMLNYTFLGLNTRDPRLQDIRVREAIAHLVDVPLMIDVVLNGYGERTVGPVPPSKSYYNRNIQPWAYDAGKAQSLLAEAGWTDSDGNGVLDKQIDGELMELKFNYVLNTGNAIREQIGQMISEEARKVGIQIELNNLEFGNYVEKLKSHDFDIFIGKWVQSPLPRDHKQIYHTESYAEGHNFTGFGTPESDALIDSIRVCVDDARRAQMNLRFQDICHEQLAYIFLFTEKNNILANKRCKHLLISEYRPGYWEASAVMQEAAQ